MNIIKKVKGFFSSPVPHWSEITISNYEGIPPEGLTWEEVSKMNLPFYLGKNPEVCPICGKTIIKYQSDYEKIEDSGQFMVLGVYCPEGHFTYLGCA